MPKHPLLHLRSVGPASLQDMLDLGIHSIDELGQADPRAMYEELCRIQGCRVDICQFDLFCCAVAQARNPELPEEQKDWHWWSRQRKAQRR